MNHPHAPRRVRLLSGLGIENEEGPIRIPGGRAQQLLARLLLYPRPTHSREALAELLWPGAPPARMRRNFSDLLYRLRAALGPGWLTATGDTLALTDPESLWVDVWEFERLLAQDDPQALVAGVALYRGPLLPTFYEDWILSRRVALHERFLTGLERLAQIQEAGGDFQTALDHYRRLVALDPLRETARQGLMRSLARLDRIPEALQEYETFQEFLARELGAPPSPELQRLAQHLQGELALRHHPRPAPGQETPFVGRVKERRALLTRLDQAYHNQGGLALVLGEPGMGKSRLLQELAEAASWRGWQVGWGHSPAYLRPSPYTPLAQALSALLPRARVQQLRQLVQPVWLHTLRRLLPPVDQLLADQETAARPRGDASGPWPDAPQDLPIALVRLLTGLQQIAPHLLILEDVHWADPALWPLLAAIQPSLAEQGILLILSARPQELRQNQAAWQQVLAWDRAGEPVLHLAGLPQEALTELVRHHTPSGGRVDRATVAHLRQRSGGNPLLALALLEAGEAPQDAQPSLDWLTEQRLALLSPEARQQVNVAAILGRRFDYETWQGVGQLAGLAGESLPQAAGELERAHILALDGRGYRFVHDTLLAGIYERIPPQERQRWHRAALEHLRRSGAASSVTLLFHAERAGDLPAVAHHALAAGEEALTQAGFEQALEHFDQALAILAQTHNPTRYRALHGRIRALSLLGRQAEQQRSLEELARLAEALDDDRRRAEVALLAAEHHRIQGQPGLAQTRAQQGLALARAVGESALEAELLLTLGRLAIEQGDYPQARAYGEQAEAIYTELGQLRGLAAALNLLGAVAQNQGRFQERLGFHQRAADLYHLAGDLHGEVRTLTDLGGVHLALGHFREATEAHQRALALCRELGDRAGEGKNLSNLGGIAMRVGQVERSLDYYEQALAISRTLGHHLRVGIDLNNLASAYFSLGRFDEALECLDECLAMARSGGFGRLEGFAQYCRGRAFLRLEQLDMARSALEASLAVRRTLGETFTATITAGDLAYVCALQGDDAAGDAALTEAMAGMAALSDSLPPDIALGLNLAAYHVRLGQGRQEEAIRYLLAAKAALAEQLADLSPEEQESAAQEMYNSQQLSAALARHTRQETVTLARADAPRGRALTPEERVTVTWTLAAPEDQLIPNRSERRRAVLARLLQEAAAQQAAPTDDDLARALGVSRRTVLRDMRALSREGIVLPTRGRGS